MRREVGAWLGVDATVGAGTGAGAAVGSGAGIGSGAIAERADARGSFGTTFIGEAGGGGTVAGTEVTLSTIGSMDGTGGGGAGGGTLLDGGSGARLAGTRL